MKTSNSNKTDISLAFNNVRQRFAEGLPQRAAAMLATVQQKSGDTMLREIIAESHKLSGACGTFGYALLGAMARQIEQLAQAVKAKTEQEQEQAIPELIHLVQEFDIEAAQATAAMLQNTLSSEPLAVTKNSIWLLLDNAALTAEITEQLHGFGMQVELFTNFTSCVKRLTKDAPTILFSAVTLANGESLFEQKLLLNMLVKQQVRLMVLAKTDSFATRIQAAQLRAEAFFCLPLDVPEIITQISELLDHSITNAGRVFIVDDDKLLAEHHALVLAEIGIETRINANIEHIIEEIVSFQPDLILMDMYMPDYSGAEIAGLLRQYRSLKRLPIVFLSSEMNKALQIRAMSHGADDFITKPIDDIQLAQAIKVRLARSLQLKNLIEKDGLTSLVRHAAIKDAAEMEFLRVERTGKPLGIVMLDIDRFKTVNDTYGHATGDLVISSLATLLRKRIRKTDRAGRYGGEEFLLVLPDCSAEQAKLLSEQILAAFSGLHFHAKDQQFNCTFSAGVVSSSDDNFVNAAQMIAAADKAMYQAKQSGRNRVLHWQPPASS